MYGIHGVFAVKCNFASDLYFVFFLQTFCIGIPLSNFFQPIFRFDFSTSDIFLKIFHSHIFFDGKSTFFSDFTFKISDELVSSFLRFLKAFLKCRCCFCLSVSIYYHSSSVENQKHVMKWILVLVWVKWKFMMKLHRNDGKKDIRAFLFSLQKSLLTHYILTITYSCELHKNQSTSKI